MTQIKPLETENLFCHYDHIKNMLFVKYHKTLSPSITTQAYSWIRTLGEAQIPVRAGVFDFRDVRHFETSNISTAQRASTEINREYDASAVAAVLIVGNAYQERMISTMNKMTPQQDRKKIVYSYEDGFEFIRAYDAKMERTHPTYDDPTILDIDGATAYYDEANNAGRMTYYGVVTQQTTADVYASIFQMGIKYDTDTVRAGIFDFRHVTEFDNSNLRTVQRTAKDLTVSFDMSRVATPLIVSTISQERMVLTAMKVTQDEKRKKIVYNYQEAYDFINKFHEQLSQSQSD